MIPLQINNISVVRNDKCKMNPNLKFYVDTITSTLVHIIVLNNIGDVIKDRVVTA